MNVNDITPQWLAGFFDGEGSVGVLFDGNVYNIQVNITQNNFNVICAIAGKFTNATYVKCKPSNIKTSKQCFAVQWKGSSAKELLEYISPYVLLKKKRVIAALEIIKHLGISNHKPMTKEQLELRNNLALNIKFMNNNQSEEEEYYGGRQLQ